MSNDLLRILRANDDRLRQTETKEVPGGIPGFTSFYDIGTWVPTYLGGTTPGATTYSVQVGTWTRTGRVIVAYGRVVWTAASGTGSARVSLPFATGAFDYGSGSLWTDGVTFAGGSPQIQLPPSQSFFEMISPVSNAASGAVVVEAAGNIGFSVTYFV